MHTHGVDYVTETVFTSQIRHLERILTFGTTPRIQGYRLAITTSVQKEKWKHRLYQQKPNSEPQSSGYLGHSAPASSEEENRHVTTTTWWGWSWAGWSPSSPRLSIQFTSSFIFTYPPNKRTRRRIQRPRNIEKTVSYRRGKETYGWALFYEKTLL